MILSEPLNESEVEKLHTWFHERGDRLRELENKVKGLEEEAKRLQAIPRWNGTFNGLKVVDVYRERDTLAEKVERLEKALHEVSDNADGGGPLSLVGDIARQAIRRSPRGLEKSGPVERRDFNP